MTPLDAQSSSRSSISFSMQSGSSSCQGEGGPLCSYQQRNCPTLHLSTLHTSPPISFCIKTPDFVIRLLLTIFFFLPRIAEAVWCGKNSTCQGLLLPTQERQNDLHYHLGRRSCKPPRPAMTGGVGREWRETQSCRDTVLGFFSFTSLFFF